MNCNCNQHVPAAPGKMFPPEVIEINNPESLVLFRKVVIPASLGDETVVLPAIGKYRNVLLEYEASGNSYLYSSDGIPTPLPSKMQLDSLSSALSLETLGRQAADATLQQEIDDIKNSPDVVDIVATYAALQAYDTSGLGDKDIIRVLTDETHDGQSTYYRWNTETSTWTYIGTAGDYYTKGQVDTLLSGKQDTLTIDTVVTESSQNPVTSGGIWYFVQNKAIQEITTPVNIYDLFATGIYHVTVTGSSADKRVYYTSTDYVSPYGTDIWLIVNRGASGVAGVYFTLMGVFSSLGTSSEVREELLVGRSSSTQGSYRQL